MDRYAQEKIRKAIEIDIEINFDGIKKAIKEECKVDEIFTENEILTYVRNAFFPEAVFDKKDLVEWAKENGFVEEAE